MLDEKKKIYLKELNDGDRFRLKNNLYAIDSESIDPYAYHTDESLKYIITVAHSKDSIFKLVKYSEESATLSGENGNIDVDYYLDGDVYEQINTIEDLNILKTNDIFPLKVESYLHDYGMGIKDNRYVLKCNNGDIICYSDYEPSFVDEINKNVLKVISRGNSDDKKGICLESSI